MDRLDAGAIAAPGLEVRVLARCSSTNDLLLKEAGAGAVLLAAEEQFAGRGRRGRRWHGAPGAGIAFSLGSPVRRPVRELAALSLVAGVAVARALRSLGLAQVALKWPNDLVVDGAKLGGILVETRSNPSSSYAVVGIGLNCRRDAQLAVKVRRPVAFLDQFMPIPERNPVIARIAAALLEDLAAFEASGLEASRSAWEAMDAHAGKRLRVRLANGTVVSGMAGGLAHDGALRLLTRSGIRAVHSGRVLSARAE